MTPAQAAYRAGCIVSEIEARFAGTKGLGLSVFGDCAQFPARLSAHLRHLWRKAIQDRAVLDLLDGWECPDRLFPPAEQWPFWIGYYHQKTARDLPADFGPRLQALREKVELSRAALAAAVGLSAESIRLFETGSRRPTWDTVQALAAHFGVTTDTFRDR